MTKATLDVPATTDSDAIELPKRQHKGDAGLDIASNMPDFFLPVLGRELVATGLRVAIPEGYAGLVVPRSGLAIGDGLTVLNGPGLIDSGYRGEIKVPLINLGDRGVYITKGERIAQLVLVEVPETRLVRTDALDSTERGEGGFGSTGR